MEMIWPILVAFVVLPIAMLGCRCASAERKPHAESMEGEETVGAYGKINQWLIYKFMRHMIVRQLDKRKPDGILVDIGCGPGHLVGAIAKSFPQLRIIGIDIAEEMIKTAAYKSSSLVSGGQVEFRQGDVHKLPFRDNTVDFVVSTLSLHHWQNPAQALEETYRVLKADGKFLLFDLRRDAHQSFYWLIHLVQKFSMPRPLKHANEPLISVLSSYTSVELENLLSTTPFPEWKVNPGLGWLFAWGHKR